MDFVALIGRANLSALITLMKVCVFAAAAAKYTRWVKTPSPRVCVVSTNLFTMIAPDEVDACLLV